MFVAHQRIKIAPSTAPACVLSMRDNNYKTNTSPGKSAKSISQNRSTVSPKRPAWRMTIKFDQIDGMMTSGSASFRPMISARIGKQVVENPMPVMPLAVAANR